MNVYYKWCAWATDGPYIGSWQELSDCLIRIAISIRKGPIKGFKGKVECLPELSNINQQTLIDGKYGHKIVVKVTTNE